MISELRAALLMGLGMCLVAVFAVGTVAVVNAAIDTMQIRQTASAGTTDDVGTQGLGPGYIDNLEDVTCGDAGTLIQSEYNGVSLDCDCDGETLFGSEAVLPLTGRSETTFSGNVRSINCRAQPATECDCWALTASRPQ